MESVMKNGFAELSADEMNEVDGGIAWAPVLIFVGKAVAKGVISGAAAWGTKKVLDWAF
jgi:hypothetical protein